MNRLKFYFADRLYKISSRQTKDQIDADIVRNLKWNTAIAKEKNKIRQLNYLLSNAMPFRSIFYFRMGNMQEGKARLLLKISQFCLPALNTIEIGSTAQIDGGFMISHNCSVIFLEMAGENLRIGPGAVIGRKGSALPKIGNNVFIAANAAVIGGITIGNNVIVGAGTVVTKNLPGNGVYIGNPARLLKHIDNDPDLLNEILSVEKANNKKL